jgi:hypothetical protein
MKIKNSFQYLDLTENTLQVGEQFSLYWKTDETSKSFNTSLETTLLIQSSDSCKETWNSGHLGRR